MDRKEYKKRWREANKEKIRLQKKEYYIANKESILKRSAEYHKINKEKINERQREFNKHNKDYRNKYERDKKKTDPLFKLGKNIRRLVQFSFQRKGFKKNNKTEQILGCSYQEFRNHIEKQFEPWMNWNNYGIYNPNGPRTWNIDHIIPLCTAKTEEDIIRLNHHSNLRPLCSRENRDKWDNII